MARSVKSAEMSYTKANTTVMSGDINVADRRTD